MTSFDIECPPSFYGCDRIDVFPEHQSDYSDFHLMKDGTLVSTIQRKLNGQWMHKSGKVLTIEELHFIVRGIENR